MRIQGYAFSAGREARSLTARSLTARRRLRMRIQEYAEAADAYTRGCGCVYKDMRFLRAVRPCLLHLGHAAVFLLPERAPGPNAYLNTCLLPVVSSLSKGQGIRTKAITTQYSDSRDKLSTSTRLLTGIMHIEYERPFGYWISQEWNIEYGELSTVCEEY